VEESHDFEKPNIDITASGAGLKAGQLLPNTPTRCGAEAQSRT